MRSEAVTGRGFLNSCASWSLVGTGVAREGGAGERRVALTPAAVSALLKAGFGRVTVERGAGEAAHFTVGGWVGDASQCMAWSAASTPPGSPRACCMYARTHAHVPILFLQPCAGLDGCAHAKVQSMAGMQMPAQGLVQMYVRFANLIAASAGLAWTVLGGPQDDAYAAAGAQLVERKGALSADILVQVTGAAWRGAA